ncbi:trypsin-like serine peptidase [Andreprevotia chitinilytica]|uniref:trypsin-like serine peptidase n=1 Tax=Andreprevotia chitinilytica TaxID=396808 RepID=UPI000689AE81|nr:trypsin-like peptidase domain-containing protein [Andreprevotia chitinilytica]
MTRFLFSILLFLAATVRADETPEQRKILFFGHDDRQFIAAPYPAPFAAIGRLETHAGSTCTATLVAPDLAVTAAHCFLMEPRKIDDGEWFKTGAYKDQYTARYKVLSQTFHPRFKQGLLYKGDDLYILPEASPYDIAWLKLKLVDGKPPQPMAMFNGDRKALQAAIKTAGAVVTQSGYAGDHEDVLTAHRGCKLTKLRPDNTILHRCDTLSGDSGSPIWLDTPNGPLLIATQSSAPDWFKRKMVDNIGVTVLQTPKRP